MTEGLLTAVFAVAIWNIVLAMIHYVTTKQPWLVGSLLMAGAPFVGSLVAIWVQELLSLMLALQVVGLFGHFAWIVTDMVRFAYHKTK